MIGFMVFVATLVGIVIAYDIELTDDPDAVTIPDTGALLLRWIPLLVWGAYEVLLLMRSGQTLGKMVTRIKVVAADGSDPIPIRMASVRWGVLVIPPVLIPDLLIGLIATFIVGMWFVFDSKRQGLHDKAARTYVVKAVRAPNS